MRPFFFPVKENCDAKFSLGQTNCLAVGFNHDTSGYFL